MRLQIVCERCHRGVDVTNHPEVAQAVVRDPAAREAFFDQMCAPSCPSRKDSR